MNTQNLLPRDQVYRLLTEIMHEELGRAEAAWNTGTRLELIEGWNSNKTVTAMLALARKLRRDFPLDALDHAGTVGDLVAVAAGHAPANGLAGGNPFAAYESLGESCEFGILQQYEGIMQPHLLRFASFTGHPAQRPRKLIAGLQDDFVRLAEPGLLEIALPEQEWDNAEKEYRILNTHYGLQIHTGFLVSAMPLDEAKRRMRDFPDSLTYLRKRLLHRLQIGGKKWLWKSAVLSAAGEIDALLAVLQKHAPNDLLWVTLGDAAHPPPAVVKLRDNLYRGYIWKSSDPWAGDWSEGKAWVDLLGAAETVLPAGILPPPVASPVQGQAFDEAHHLLNTIVAAQLDDPDLVLRMEMRPADVDGWDSLKHINIILEVEKELGTTFTQDELEAMLNVGDFVALIAGRLPQPEEPKAAGNDNFAPPGNNHVILNNTRADRHPATVIVSGFGNAGCSAAAAMLDGFGMAMESQTFITALAACDYAGIATLTEQRNEGGKPWGLVLPSIHERILPGQVSMFRNPVLIFVMQDIVSVTTEITAQGDNPQSLPKAYLEAVNAAYRVAGFLEKVQCPALILSHEKILKFPGETVAAIAEFCGLTAGDPSTVIPAPQEIRNR